MHVLHVFETITHLQVLRSLKRHLTQCTGTHKALNGPSTAPRYMKSPNEREAFPTLTHCTFLYAESALVVIKNQEQLPHVQLVTSVRVRPLCWRGQIGRELGISQ